MLKKYKLFDIILVFSIFTFGFRIQEIVALVYLAINFKKIKINIKSFIILQMLLVPTFYYIISTESIGMINKASQQIFIIGSCFLSYLLLVKKNGIKETMNLYSLIVQVVVVLGGIQFIIFQIFKKDIFIFILGKSYIENQIISINSISGEPGMYAQLLLPYVIYRLEIIYKTKKIRWIDILVFFNILMTRTAIAYFSLAIYFILKLYLLKNKKIKSILVILGIIVVPFIYKILNKNIIMKIEESFKALYNIFTIDLKAVNLSTFALFSNLRAYINSQNYLFGNGLGSIEETYYNFFKNEDYYFYGINSTDGYSLFIRVLSEFGIVGIGIFLIYILYNLNLSNKDIYSSINISAFIGVLSYLLRGGSYFMHGTLLFLILLIFSNSKHNEIQ